MMHADRTNRVVLALLGTLLAAAGGAGVLAGTPLSGDVLPYRPLLDNPIGRFWGGHSAWAWPAAAALTVFAAIVALRWLVTIVLSTDRVGDIVVAKEGSAGSTTLSAAALSDALDAEIGAYHGVRSARSRVVGGPTRPMLVVVVDTDRTADLAGLRERIEATALSHARQALDRAELPIRLDLTIGSRNGSRVV
jgi:hypothetical protein